MRTQGSLSGIQGDECHRKAVTDSTASYFNEGFTDPFRYVPHPLVREAAAEVISRIDGSPELSEAFAEGKMCGVAIVEMPACAGNEASVGYIAAFSGTVGGKSLIEGFVPPIYDLLEPEGTFRKQEAEISELNRKIEEAVKSPEIISLKNVLAEAERSRDLEIGNMKARMAESRRRRDRIRSTAGPDASVQDGLIRESQYEKAELRRLKLGWEARIADIRQMLDAMLGEIAEMKSRRAEMSDALQRWIFSRYVVHNASGEESSVGDIFAAEGLVPPGGTGECAAPKLLEYAYRNGMKPLAMGEFWYGRSPATAVRTHGHFYPSCTSKCGPLLGFMMRGLDISHIPEEPEGSPETIYEDDAVIIVSKPSGMPSVPGLDGRISLQETLAGLPGHTSRDICPVHRLDMDTSGIMVFAKTEDAAVDLRRQFEEHSVRKTYSARLAAPNGLKAGQKGRIELPLSADYDERPRQKADKAQGKSAITDYEVIRINEDGTADVTFHPVTGRTHQLRVHSAHTLGLGAPILGDLLYGSHTAFRPQSPSRLCLHASAITFRHPSTGRFLTFNAPPARFEERFFRTGQS